MFYEERINDGFLEYRTTPGGEWRSASPKFLTTKLRAANARIAELERAQLDSGEWVSFESRLPSIDEADCHGKVWVTDGLLVYMTPLSALDEDLTHWMPTGIKKPEPPK